MALCPRLTAYPPLGKVTVLEPGQTEIRFSAYIEWEWNRSLPFQAELLYADANSNTHPSTWSSVPLLETSERFSVVRHENDGCQCAAFTALVETSSLVTKYVQGSPARIIFTLRYRSTKLYPWKLVYGYGGVDTGDIVIPAAEPRATEIEDLLSVSEGWTVNQLSPSENTVPTYRITSIQAFSKHQGEDTQLESLSLGSIRNQLRFMAVIRIEPYWYGCTQDREFFHLENDASMVCFLTTSGACLCVLALSADDDFYTVFQSDQQGALVVGGRNDGPQAAPLAVIAAISLDPQKAIAAVMLQARHDVAQRPKMRDFVAINKALKSSSTEDFFDSFGYCTYNGLGLGLTDKKVISGLDELVKNNVQFDTLIIDDNWQTVGKTLLDFTNAGWRGWTRFEANEEGFPSGLAALIQEIKLRYPHIKYVGVWHALLGYWAGLSHDSSFGEQYKLRKTVAKVRGNIATEVIVVDPSDAHRFYDDFYRFLRSCGIDFVKTDVQHMLSMFVNPSDRAEIPNAYQSAWTAAYLRHFEGKAISCMSLVPQVTLHSLLQFETPPILVRNSDDFFPEIPDSHPFHLFVNAHNALVTQHLNCVPDWDMFQTSHPYSSFHGAARCISGGPVLITDVPGQHSTELINQMTASTPSGGRIALRPKTAVTVDMWDNFANGQVLKIRTSTANSVAMMGVFNIAPGVKEIFVPIDDFFSGPMDSQPCLIRSFRTGQIFNPQHANARLLQVKLETRGWDILSLFPLRVIGQDITARFACLGLLDKMSGAAAIVNCDVYTAENEPRAVVRLKALGKAGLFLEDGLSLGKVHCEDHDIEDRFITSQELANGGKLVTVDLEACWNGQTRDSQAQTIAVTFALLKKPVA